MDRCWNDMLSGIAFQISAAAARNSKKYKTILILCCRAFDDNFGCTASRSRDIRFSKAPVVMTEVSHAAGLWRKVVQRAPATKSTTSARPVDQATCRGGPGNLFFVDVVGAGCGKRASTSRARGIDAAQAATATALIQSGALQRDVTPLYRSCSRTMPKPGLTTDIETRRTVSSCMKTYRRAVQPRREFCLVSRDRRSTPKSIYANTPQVL